MDDSIYTILEEVLEKLHVQKARPPDAMASGNFLFVSSSSRFSKVAEKLLHDQKFPHMLLHLDTVQSRRQASSHPQYPITQVPTLLVTHPSGFRIRYVGIEEIAKYVSSSRNNETYSSSRNNETYSSSRNNETYSPESAVSSDDDVDFPPLPEEEVNEEEIEEVVPVLVDEPIPMSTSQLETPQDFVPPSGMKDVLQRAAEMEKQRDAMMAKFERQAPVSQ